MFLACAVCNQLVFQREAKKKSKWIYTLLRTSSMGFCSWKVVITGAYFPYEVVVNSIA